MSILNESDIEQNLIDLLIAQSYEYYYGSDDESCNLELSDIEDEEDEKIKMVEVKKIEEVLGSAATSQNPLTSTWTGSFSQATTWGTLYDRIANIESGLIAGVTGLLPNIVRGDLVIGSGTSTIARLALGASGTVLTSNGTTATWVAPTTSFVSQTNGTVSTASTSSGVVRNVWTSTSAPTSGQGADGDVWLVYV
jgi:hypothetical protein